MSECLICKKKENGLYPVFVCQTCLRHVEIGRRITEMEEGDALRRSKSRFYARKEYGLDFDAPYSLEALKAAKIGGE